MKYSLKLEFPSYNAYKAINAFSCKINPFLDEGKKNHFNWPSPVWVSEILGFCDKFKYKRMFLKKKIDFSEANSKCSRYVYAYFLLDEGKLYEVRGDKIRYFCISQNQKLTYLNEEQVNEWLKKQQ